MVIKKITAVLLACLTAFLAQAQIPDSGEYTGHYQITMRAAPLGNVLGFGVNKPEWRWDFTNDTATVHGTTLSVGFNYALHDLNNADPNSDILNFTRNSDGTITLHYALQIYHPGLANPMANASTRFRVSLDGAKLKIAAVDWEEDGLDGIAGTKIYNVFPLTIEPDLMGYAVASGVDSNLDGIDDQTALKLGLNPNSFDTDGDGISDWDEVGGDMDSPLDSDLDSVIDALEEGDSALSAFLASGLTTLNEQKLNVKTTSELEIRHVAIGNMQQSVDDADSSDDFANLDSTLGQPGLDYPWGNLSLEFIKPVYAFDEQQIELTFSAALPDRLVIYAYNPNAANKYQLIPAAKVKKRTENSVTISVSSSDSYLQEDANGERYQLTVAIAENTLGNKNVKEDKVSSAGSTSVSLFFVLGLLLVLRRGDLKRQRR